MRCPSTDYSPERAGPLKGLPIRRCSDTGAVGQPHAIEDHLWRGAQLT